MIAFSLKSSIIKGQPERAYVRASMTSGGTMVCGLGDYIVLGKPEDHQKRINRAARRVFRDFLDERSQHNEHADAVVIDDNLYGAVADLLPSPTREMAA